MKQIIRFILIFLVAVAVIHFTKVFAQEAVPSRPTSHYVLDNTNTLSASEISKIDSIAKDVETNKKVSFAVLLVPTTSGEDIAQFSHRVAEQWKPGVDGIGKGALLVIAKEDRKFRVEVSKNLEGELPDATIKHVLDETKGHFKAGRFGEGIHDIVRELGAKTGSKPEVMAIPVVESSSADSLLIGLLGIFGVCGIGAFFIKRHHDEAERKRALYLAERDAYYRKAESERVAARRAKERREEEERAKASVAISSLNFAPAYSAPLAATAGLSGAAIKKTQEAPRPTVSKPVVKSTPTRRADSYETPSYPSYSSSSFSSSSSSSDSSSSSSSSYSSSSSSDYGGGGSSSDW